MGSLVCNERRFKRIVMGAAATLAMVAMVGLSGVSAFAAPSTDLSAETASATEGATTPSTDLSAETASATEGATTPSTDLSAETASATEGATTLPAGDVLPAFMGPTDGDVITVDQSFFGGGFPGQVVSIFYSDGRPLCSVTVDDTWTFECVPDAPLSLGPLSLTAEVINRDETVVVTGPYSFIVTGRPTLSSPADGSTVGDLPEFIGTGEPGVDIDILGGRSGLSVCSSVVRDDGTFSCVPKLRFLVGTADFFPAISKNREQQIAGDMLTITVAVTPVIVSPINDDVVAGAVEISGTAGVFATVAILDGNGKTVCSAESDRDGTFSCVANPALSVGKHTLTPVQTSKSDGSIITGAGIEVSVNADGVVPSAPGPTRSAVIETVTSAPTATSPATAKSTATTQQLAATGATGTIWLAVVGGALLLLGGASLLTRFRRRTHG